MILKLIALITLIGTIIAIKENITTISLIGFIVFGILTFIIVEEEKI